MSNYLTALRWVHVDAAKPSSSIVIPMPASNGDFERIEVCL